MSAVEALAEVLDRHRYVMGGGRDSIPHHCSCGQWDAPSLSYRDYESNDAAFRAHVSEALVAAIRSMPAEQVAEERATTGRAVEAQLDDANENIRRLRDQVQIRDEHIEALEKAAPPQRIEAEPEKPYPPGPRHPPRDPDDWRFHVG